MKYGIIATKTKDEIIVDVYNENFLKVTSGKCIDGKSIVMCAAYAIMEYREATMNIPYCGATPHNSETVLLWKHNFLTYTECILRIMEVIDTTE